MFKLDVLIVAPFFPSVTTPYAGIFISEQAHALINTGVNVNVVRFVPATPWPLPLFKQKWKDYCSIPQHYQWNDLKVSSLRYIAIPRNTRLEWTVFQMESKLEQYISRTKCKPDIIHAHFAYPSGLAAVRCGAKYGIPTLVTVHGSDIHSIPKIKQRYHNEIVEMLQKADQILAVSDYIKRKALSMCPSANIMLHRIGIDLTKFKPYINNAVRKELFNFDDYEGSLVVYIGNLLASKGVLDLLKAISEIKYKPVHLAFIGDGPMVSKILSESKKLGLQSCVHVLGSCSHEKVPHYLSAADIFVLPSYREGLPTICVEALACECPVIASNVGGIPELIKNAITGLLVQPGDHKYLSEALTRIIVEPSYGKKMARNGRLLVEKDYDIVKNARDLISIYQRFI